MKNGNRLLALLLLLLLYAILSTSLFTKLLLTESAPSASFLNDEVLVIDESDDKLTDDSVESTDEDGDDDDTQEVEQSPSNNPYTCQSEGAPAFLPSQDIVRRSLHGVIIGTQKGGTQALHTILLTHPKILTSGTGHGELHFFNRYYSRLVGHSHTIPRQQSRNAFLKTLKERNNAKRMAKAHGKKDITSELNANSVGFHSAPLYLFSGRKVPERMFCTAPWIKVIALLRNPIERAYSQYHFVLPLLKSRKAKSNKEVPTFEEFVMEDIDLLKQFGVLRDWNTTNFTSYSDSQEEYEAWEKYITIAKGDGPIGRGLYSIQLGIWIQEFQNFNKPLDDLLVLQSEVTKLYPQEAYHQSVQLFGLEPRTKQVRHKHEKILGKNHHATNYQGSEGMSEEMWRMLYDLFEPYNRRLVALLGEEWEGVWVEEKVVEVEENESGDGEEEKENADGEEAEQ